MRRPQVSVVGSASGSESLLALAEQLGEAIIDAGWRIVCGGRFGVMEAVGRGARNSAAATGSDVIGILPTLRASDGNEFIDIVVPTGMQHARNTLVVSTGDVVVALGGGAGTLSEIALAWQLNKPVIALASEPGWAAELAGRRLDTRRDDTIAIAQDVAGLIAAVRVALASESIEPVRI